MDCIYIDPPYNTGAQDWKYNNNYVDDNDSYRHSKWLSMMEKRLRLAKKLLKKDGVLVCAIDENEVTRLGLLLEDIFPGEIVQLVTIVTKADGAYRKKHLSRVGEYVYLIFLGESLYNEIEHNLLLEEGADENIQVGEYSPVWRNLRRDANNRFREDAPNLFFPVIIDSQSKKIIGAGGVKPTKEGDPKSEFETKNNQIYFWPWLPNDKRWGNWKLGRKTFLECLDKGYVKLLEAKDGCLKIGYIPKAGRDEIERGDVVILEREGSNTIGLLERKKPKKSTPKTIWWRKWHNSSSYGTKLLDKFIPSKTFDYPKSLYSVRDCLNVAVGSRKNALILDFFAGSGTTAHSVFLMNAKDGGTRRSILVTNNEVGPQNEKEFYDKGIFRGDTKWESQGIFESATRPRIEAVVTGKRKDKQEIKGKYLGLENHELADGFDESVDFFNLEYLDRDELEFGIKEGRGLEKIIPVLWMKAGSIGECPSGSNLQEALKAGYFIPDNSNFGVLLKDSKYLDFKSALDKRLELDEESQTGNVLSTVWIFTEQDEVFGGFKDGISSAIKVRQMLKIYVNSFEEIAKGIK